MAKEAKYQKPRVLETTLVPRSQPQLGCLFSDTIVNTDREHKFKCPYNLLVDQI